MSPHPRPRATRALAAGAAAALGLGLVASAPAGAATTIRASFRAGVLTVDGTSAADTITVGRTTVGQIQVNGGAIPISGATPTVDNTSLVSIDGLGGADRLTIAGHSMPQAELLGGNGADTLTGGPRIDLLAGGQGADTLAGGTGDDDLQGGTEDDTFFWMADDQHDTMQGGPGRDRVTIVGDERAESYLINTPGPHAASIDRSFGFDDFVQTTDVEKIGLTPGAGADTITIRDVLDDDLMRRIDLDLGTDAAADAVAVVGTTITDTTTVGPASTAPTAPVGQDIRIAGGDPTDTLLVDAGQGDDVVDLSALPAGQLRTTVQGDEGADRITGTAGADEVVGGEGADTIAAGAGVDRVVGSAGDDTIDGGAGDDLVEWLPGDGSDRIDDGAGRDRLQVTGIDTSEKIGLQRVAGRIHVTRDVGAVALDTAGLEEVGIDALSGTDTITVGDLGGSTLDLVDIDMRKADGFSDGFADTVIHTGTPGADSQLVTGKVADNGRIGGSYNVTGTGPTVEVVGSEAAKDTVAALGGLGTDSLRTSGTVPAKVLLDGGADADILVGGPGNDVLRGNIGSDVISVSGTSGSDTVEGGTGADRYIAGGTGSAERFTLDAVDGRTRVRRDLGGTGMLDDVETVEVRPGRARDTVRVGDLMTTETTSVLAQLESVTGTGAGDREVDQVEVIGRQSGDTVTVAAAPGTARASGLHAVVDLLGLDPTDGVLLTLNGGSDRLDAAAVAAGRLLLTVDGGSGRDTLTTTKGDDVIRAGEGDDIVAAGPGRDTVDGGPGTDTVTGGEVLTNVP